MGWTTIDREGVGKGKVRWFTEVMERDAGMKMAQAGPVRCIGRKWEKDVDMMWILFDVEGWRPRGKKGKEGEEDLRKLGWVGETAEEKIEKNSREELVKSRL